MSNSYSWIDDLCEQVAIENGFGIKGKAVKRVLKSLYKVILRQLKINGKISIPKFGIFEIEHSDGGERKLGDVHNGGVKYIYTEPRNKVVFRMSQALDRNVNENQFQMRNEKSKTLKPKREKIKPIEFTLAQALQTAHERGNNNGKTNL